MNGTYLIVNADDFGISRGTTDGIIRSHATGIVTSTSLLVNLRASEYAIAEAARYPSLSVGIHLNLTHGRPALPPSKVPTLVDRDGRFYRYSELVKRLWRGRVSRAEIEAEFSAQIAWMHYRGVNPTHADSHEHIHLYPFATHAFRSALIKAGIRKTRCARYYSSQGSVACAAHAGGLLRRSMVASYRRYVDQVIFRGLTAPDFSVSLDRHLRGNLATFQTAVSKAIEYLPPGTYELGCHPGLPEKGFSDGDDYCERRKVELEAFTSPEIRAIIQRKCIHLLSYRDLGDHYAAGYRTVLYN